MHYGEVGHKKMASAVTTTEFPAKDEVESRSGSNEKFTFRWGPLVGITLFLTALWSLHHQLRAYHYHDIVQHFGILPKTDVGLAVIVTVLNYLVLTAHEILAFRYIAHPLRYWKIAFTSFISNALSNNIGFSMLAGSSVRFRLYSVWGLSTIDIVRVIIFYAVTFSLGLLAVGGSLFISEPLEIPKLLHLPLHSAFPIGCLFLLLLAAYLGWSAFGPPTKFGKWEFSVPSLRLAFYQVIVSSLDWALAGGVLYVLLPPSVYVSFPAFLSVFILAQIAGLVSQVPGGLGVFETVMLFFLGKTAPPSAVFGALLAYRGIYYLFPLILAVFLLGVKEILDRSQGLKRFSLFFGQWIPELIPYALAFTTFVSGCILLFSGATPSVGSRLAWLKDFLPLPVMEVSHFLGSLAGIGLIFLARGLQRRLDAAYIFTALLLTVGIVFSILKGIDYEEAIALSIMLTALLPAHKYFYRKASLFSEPLTTGWFSAVLAVLACTTWLGFFSFKHVDYSDELWWHFAFSGDAPRFLRALVGVAGTVFTFALAKVFFATRTRPKLPTTGDLERAFTILRQTKETYANLALLGDKEFLFSEHGNAFLMYAVQGRSWIVFGDTVGPEEEVLELMWRFRELCDRYDGWPVFYNVKRDYLSYYLDLGLNVIKIGEEAHIAVNDFTIVGGAHKGLRYAHNRIEKEGCRFRLIERSDVPSVLPTLKAISDAWLRKKNTKEKRFSLGFFDFRYLAHFPIAVVEKENRPIAFANVFLGADQTEISIDLMRYLPEAPPAVMEYFLVELILLGKKLGYRWFNLGGVPLAGLQDRMLASVWSRFGAFLFEFGEHFYNFQGLLQFKEKFDPVWEPKYLVSPGGMILPRILTDLAALISGGLKGLVWKDS